MNKRRKYRYKLNYFRVGITVSVIVLIVFIISLIASSCSDKKENSISTSNNLSYESDSVGTIVEVSGELSETDMPFVVYPKMSKNADYLASEFDAKYAIIIDTETNEILAYRNYNRLMYPASLTKVMSLIIAVENIKDFSDTIEITNEMIAPMLAVDASVAGFAVGEKPTLEQLLYGMILPSGADATLAIAKYVSGSEENFVTLMNEKAMQMGLKNTNFTNAVGLHNDKHYSTVEDMALILSYAIQNEMCRKVLSTYQYDVPPTELNPEGLTLTSTLFSRMYGDEMPGVTIKGGKTGFTDKAMNCIASFAEANDKIYITVLGYGTTKWFNIYDTLSAFSIYCVNGKAYVPPKLK